MTNDLNGVITAAKSFIRSHLVSLNTPTINAGVTPRLTHYQNCYFLYPPQSIPNIASNALGYLIYWKGKGAKVCWGGGLYGNGTKGKPTASIPFDTEYFFRNGGWDGVMCYGTEITIHELHHMFENALHIRGYPTSKSKSGHVYGRNVPHLDYMSAFGFGQGEDKRFTAWAYEQITSTMLSQISSTVGIAVYNGGITPPPPTPPPPTPPPPNKIDKAGIITELGKKGAINLSSILSSAVTNRWYYTGRTGFLTYTTGQRQITFKNVNTQNPPSGTRNVYLIENRQSVSELDKEWVLTQLAKLPYGAAPPTPPPPPSDTINKTGIINEIRKKGKINIAQLYGRPTEDKWYYSSGMLMYTGSRNRIIIHRLETKNPPTGTGDIDLAKGGRAVNELDKTWVLTQLAKLPYGAAPPPPPPPPEDKITKAGIISELKQKGAINLSQVSTTSGTNKWYYMSRSGYISYTTGQRQITFKSVNTQNPPSGTGNVYLIENRRSVNELDREWVLTQLAKLPYGAAPPPPPPPPEQKTVTFESTPPGASVSIRQT